MSSPTEEFDQNTNVLREDMVETAVKFLQNPKVLKSPLVQKQNFLKRKGLNDDEIRLACERSGAYALHEQHNKTQIIPPSTHPLATNLQTYSYSPHGTLQLSFLDRVREVIHNMAAFSFIAYIIYKFYEKFIAPFLFGKRKKSVEESLHDLDKNVKSSLNNLQTDLQIVRVEVDKLSHTSGINTYQQLHELKAEISTVKGLLLSRKQFPAVSSQSPVVPPSIPAWQLSSVPDAEDHDHDGKSEEMEVGSGSGSSEPEHSTHKSDSSLEIIYSNPSDSESYHRKSCDETDKD